MPTRRQALFNNAMRNSEIVRRSYLWGWHIDPIRQAAIAQQITEGIQKEDERLRGLLTHPSIPKSFAKTFNPNSPPQLGKLFYDILEERVRFRTPTGNPGAGKDALQKMTELSEDPAKSLAGCLRQRKILAKLKEAYIDNLQGITIVRPSAHVTAQVGGRWSYRDPALQTVPAKIKPMFITRVDPKTGKRNWMVACDLAGAELRTMAVQSGDQGMLDIFAAGGDLHALTAQIAWGCTAEEAKTDPYRNPAKTLGLGAHYSVLDSEGAAAGLHAQLIAKVPGITIEKVLGAVKRLEEGRPRVFEFKQETLDFAHANDYVEEPLNRRRRYFYGKVKDTESYNFAQQSMVSAIMDRGVQGIDAELDHTREGLLLQRHDEVIHEGPDARRLVHLQYEHLRQTHGVSGNSMNFEVDFWLGHRWGEGGTVIELKENRWLVEFPGREESARFDDLDKALDFAIPLV